MNPLAPFAYPSVSHVRSHAPVGYRNYQDYKPWLRDEFAFRCVYCLARERWYPNGHAAFGVEHLEPQSVAPHLATSYPNLVYACNECNSCRRDEPLSVSPLEPLAVHLAVDTDGVIRGLTPEGEELVALTALDSPGRTRLRADMLLLHRAQAADPDDAVIGALFRTAFGYPDDLPDLTLLRPPGDNLLAGSESASHHARRLRHALPDVY